MRQCVNKAEEHINTLLKENQHLCEEYRRLYSDYCLLEEQNQSVRHAVNSRQTGGSYTPSNGAREVHNEVSAQIPVCPISPVLLSNWTFVTLTRRLPTALNFCPPHRNEFPRKWRHLMRVRKLIDTEYRTRMHNYRPHQHLRRPKSSYIHSITVRIPLILWLFYRFLSSFAYILVQFTNSI